MAHRSGGLVESSRSTNWNDGIAWIMQERRDEIKRAIARNDRDLGDAEERLDVAKRKFEAAKIKFGKNSGHRDYQRADMRYGLAHGVVKHRLGEARRLRAELQRVNDEHSALVNSVRSFLSGADPQAELYSMSFSVVEGDDDKLLNVYLRNPIGKLGGRSLTFKLDERMYVKRQR